MKPFMTALLATLLSGVLSAGTVAAQTIDRIKETAELRLGYRTDAPPLSFAAEDGGPSGYSVFVCAELAQGILNAIKIPNMEVEFIPVSADEQFDKVATGEIDLLCGAASITLGRRELVDFSIPIFADGTSVLLPVDVDATVLELSGKKLGVRKDTTTETALTNTLADTATFAEVVRFGDHAAGLAAMEAGDIDAYFADQSILAGLWANSSKRDSLQLGNALLTIEQHGLAMKRGDTEFRLLVDRALSSMYHRGIMQQIFQTTMPGVQPGEALRAMFNMAPLTK